MKKIEEKKTIQITDETGEIFLTTTVGNGNLGGGNVKNTNGEKIATGLLASFPLGKGSELKDKKIIVTTNGLDINPSTDDVPVTHKFSGTAFESATFDFDTTADSDGVVSYVIEYAFK